MLNGTYDACKLGQKIAILTRWISFSGLMKVGLVGVVPIVIGTFLLSLNHFEFDDERFCKARKSIPVVTPGDDNVSRKLARAFNLKVSGKSEKRNIRGGKYIHGHCKCNSV